MCLQEWSIIRILSQKLSMSMRVDNTKIRRLRDLVNAFINQYKFNINVVPHHYLFLQNMEKSPKKTIYEYT
jgi:hypothetical protein